MNKGIREGITGHRSARGWGNRTVRGRGKMLYQCVIWNHRVIKGCISP